MLLTRQDTATGLDCCLCFALFFFCMVFAFNPQQDPSINLLAILQLWAWISGGVYKKRCLDALENLFGLNLIILVGSTYHVKLSGGNQLAVDIPL